MTNQYLRSRFRSATLLLPLFFYHPTTATAAPENDRGMDTTVVTGTRLPGSVTSMASHVTMIDRSDLDARQHQSLLDVLRNVAGLHVTQYGGRGGVASVFMRGAEPNFTVVLINGVKVNDPNNTRGGSFDFSTINLAEVERIEIVRGAQSSVYGSDGLAGIINILTRSTSEEFSAVFEAEVGEQGFLRSGLHTSGSLAEHTQFAFSVSMADDGEAIEGNHFEDTNLTGRLLIRATPDLTIDLSGRFADAESRSYPEDSGGAELAVIRAVDQRDQSQSSVAATLKYSITDKLALNLRSGYTDHQEVSSSPGVVPGVRQGVPPNRSDSQLERMNLGVNLVFDLSDTVSATVGLDRDNEEGNLQGSLDLAPGFSAPTDFVLKRDITGLFAEVRLANNVHQGFGLNFSIRRDEPSDEGSQTSGRIGMQYQLGETRIFGNWSEGFKLPSFFALGHALVGNPDLRPESSRNIELGVSHVALRDVLQEQLSITFALFSNEFDNLIDFDPDLFTNVNRRRVDTTGVELSAQYQPRQQLQFAAHLTYVDIDVSGNTRLRQRPDWRGGVSAYWDMTPTLSIAGDLTIVGESFDTAIPTGPRTLDAYQTLDLELAWHPRPRLRVWLTLDNLLSEDFEEAIGFQSITARARAGVRVEF